MRGEAISWRLITPAPWPQKIGASRSTNEGIAWAVFDREGESQNSLGRRALEELGASSSGSSRARATRASADSFSRPARRKASSLVPTSASSRPLPPKPRSRRTSTGQHDTRSHREDAGAGRGRDQRRLLRRRLRARTRVPLPHRHPRRRHALGFPEVRLGIFPGFNGTARSIRQAAQWLPCHMLAGSMIRAGAARGMGLVDRARRLPRPTGAGPLARPSSGSANRSPPAHRSVCTPCGPPARCSPARCAKRRQQESPRGSLSRPVSSPSTCSRSYGGDYEGHEGRRDAGISPLMVSDTSRNLHRVFWLSELLKGQAPKKLGWSRVGSTSSAPAPWALTLPAGASPAAWR